MKIILVALLLCVLIVPAAAGTNDWRWRIDSAYFGVSDSALDDIDQQDQLATTNPYWYVATYKENSVDGWTGDTGFYCVDIRSPISLIPGASKTWEIYFWADPSCPYTFMDIDWGWNMSYWPAFEQMEYRLTYVRPAEGISGDSTVQPGDSVLLNVHQQGGWRFPVYKTDNGLEGYKFELTATVIPEPSSLLALAAGLVPLAGLALRRRRK